MSLEALALDERMEAPQEHALDGLIAGYFDRAFLFFSLFVDDPRTCLDLSDAVFRGMDDRHVCEESFYRELVHGVRGLADKNEFLPGVSSDSVLCWLLKDSADLSYAEIGALMTLERQQVAERIAEVRGALLG